MWREICFLLIMVGIALSKLTGDHVCATEEPYTVNVTESFIRNITVRNYQWCLNVPPRCSFYTSKQVNDSRIVEKNYTRIVETCCPGFKEDLVNYMCIPNCTDCIHGLCNRGKCVCLSGFKGNTCDTECEPTQWGINCKYQCICERGSCDAQTGNCICPSGWNGSRCNETCSLGYYGINCINKCQCEPNEICDSISGSCHQISTAAVETEDSKEYDSTKDYRNVHYTLDDRLGTTKFRTNSNPEFRKNPTLLKYHTFSLQTTPIPRTKETIYSNKHDILYLGKNRATTNFYKTTINPTLKTTIVTTTPFNNLSNDYFTQIIKSVSTKPLQEETTEDTELSTESNNYLKHLLNITSSSTIENITKNETYDVQFKNNGKFNYNDIKIESNRNFNNKDNLNSVNLNYQLPLSTTTEDIVVPKFNKNQVDKIFNVSNEDEKNIEPSEEILKPSKEKLKNSLSKHISETTNNFEEVYLENPEVYGEKKNPTEKDELVNSVSISVALGIVIIIIAIVALTLNRRRKKKKENKADGVNRSKTSTVSVYTHSIFHTPLPDPPRLETTFSDESSGENTTFETRVICSMNFPTSPNFKDPREYLYDHPPSTGSYRAASIPEPPELEMSSNSILSLKQIEPVYDEIPCIKGNTVLHSSQPQPYNSTSSLYINTCGKTRL